MSNVWFTSDLHLGHRNVHKYRTQFENEQHHRDVIKENYHKVVTKRDKVYFLGDVAFTQECLEDVGSWVGEKKVLIAGNHCTENLPMSEIVKYFDEVHGLVKYKEFWLSHAPLHSQELRGKYNLHGHMHFDMIKNSRYLNVCLEHTNYTPIDLNEVRKRLNINKES